MLWKIREGDVSLGEKKVEIRSLRVPDDNGRLRRLRTTTSWDQFSPRHTATPAEGRLVRESSGQIGVRVAGRHQGYLKLGSLPGCFRSINVPLNALSKKPLFRLLRGTGLELVAEEGQLFARERSGYFPPDN